MARQFGITRRDLTNWMAVKGGYAGPACDLCVEFDLMAGLRPAPALPKRGRAKLFAAPGPDDVQDVSDDAFSN